MRQDPIEAVINGVHVHRYGNARAVRDARRVRHGGRIVPVDMQQARAQDLVRRDLGGIDTQALGPRPQHGALPGGAIDDDVGRLIGAARAALHVVHIDARLAQAGQLDAPALVVADGADVLGAQAQPCAGRHGAGHLAAGTDDLLFERHLAGVGGEAGDYEERVGGVQSYAGHVELRGHATIVVLLVGQDGILRADC